MIAGEFLGLDVLSFGKLSVGTSRRAVCSGSIAERESNLT